MPLISIFHLTYLVARIPFHEESASELGRMLFRCSVLISCSAMCLGCSPQIQDLVPVTGQCVWEDGTPISSIDGFIRFEPIDLHSEEYSPLMEQQSIIGKLAGNGRFELVTYQMKDGETLSEDGAPIGDYKVLVFLASGPEGKALIDPDYEHHARTPLSATIGLDDNHFEFKVDRNFKGRDARRRSNRK